MSYRPHGLGQAKWVPGQISFAALPQGQTALPNVQRLVEAGLPIAPYIEHGSFITGEPAIMRYGLDPYRGIMGLGIMGLGSTERRMRHRTRRRALGESGDGLGNFFDDIGSFIRRLLGGGSPANVPVNPGDIPAGAAIGRTAEQQALVDAGTAAVGRARALGGSVRDRMRGPATITCGNGTSRTTVGAVSVFEAMQMARNGSTTCQIRLSDGSEGEVDGSRIIRQLSRPTATSGLGDLPVWGPPVALVGGLLVGLHVLTSGAPMRPNRRRRRRSRR